MMNVLKLGCLVIYGLALIGLAGVLPPALASAMQMLTILMLAVHALELLFAFRFLHLHRGGMAASVAFALLFGVLHWGPLARASRGGSR
jgi:uncharacterized protein YhhL (DUF1145 family)